MSKQTVIDWQRDSVLVATGNQRGSKFSIEKLSRQSIGELADNTTLKQAVASASSELGNKGPVVVVVARELVEVRTISIPRMDAAELPDVIRFQAQRQLANMGENWLLDFVLLPDAPGQEMLTALVGVIAPQELSLISAACEGAGYQISHVGLRPLEIARYAVQSNNLPASGASMMISISGSNADLMLLKDGRVVQIRSTKLPSDHSQAVTAIQGEVRRSLMAASGQLGQEPLASVMLLASEQVAASMQTSIAEASSATVSVVSPSSLLSDAAPAIEVEDAGLRFAAIAGATALPIASKETTIDFLSPKKRPAKKSHKQTYILAAAAGVLVIGGALTWWRSSMQGMRDQLASLQAQAKSAEEKEAIYKQVSKEAGMVENFLDNSPNWLDELTYISKKIPPSDKVRVYGTSFTTTNTGRSQISIAQVLADSDTTLDEFEDSLRSDNHEVATLGRQILAKPEGNYRWAEAPVVITLSDRGWPLMDGPEKRKKPTTEAVEKTPASETPEPNESAAAEPEPEKAASTEPGDAEESGGETASADKEVSADSDAPVSVHEGDDDQPATGETNSSEEAVQSDSDGSKDA